MAANMKFKTATDMKFKMVTTVARQQGNNTTPRPGQVLFKGQNLPLSDTVTFVVFNFMFKTNILSSMLTTYKPLEAQFVKFNHKTCWTCHLSIFDIWLSSFLGEKNNLWNTSQVQASCSTNIVFVTYLYPTDDMRCMLLFQWFQYVCLFCRLRPSG